MICPLLKNTVISAARNRGDTSAYLPCSQSAPSIPGGKGATDRSAPIYTSIRGTQHRPPPPIRAPRKGAAIDAISLFPRWGPGVVYRDNRPCWEKFAEDAWRIRCCLHMRRYPRGPSEFGRLKTPDIVNSTAATSRPFTETLPVAALRDITPIAHRDNLLRPEGCRPPLSQSDSK